MRKSRSDSPNDPAGCKGRISLDINDRVIWNYDQFLEFLVTYQGQVIDVEIPEGACLTSLGVYKLMDKFKFKAVNIRTHNLVELAPAPYKIEIHPFAFRYFDVPPQTNYDQYQHWTGKRVFGALYNRPIWTRLGLTGHLLSRYPEKTLLNFRHDPHNLDEQQFFELDFLFQNSSQSFNDYAKINHQLPIRLEDQDSYTIGQTTEVHTNQVAQFYPDFLIDIVAETFVRGRSFYPTEKTTRPMLLKKPFILMGPKCFLIHLRQMGFRTFHDFWDEDYDGYQPDLRYNMILKLIDSLSTKSTDELMDMYSKMKPILEHNYNLLLEKSFIKQVDYTE